MGTEGVPGGDRTISTLAIVKAMFDRQESFLGYLEPFLEHCLSASEPDEISVPELQVKIIQTFGLRLPMGVIKTLLRRQEQVGNVVVRRNVCLIERSSLGVVDLEPVRQEAMREQGALIEKLQEYVRDNFPQQDWEEGRAQDQLLLYVEQFSARVFQATMGKDGMAAIRPTSAHDQHVVHSFVLHAVKEDPTSFNFLTSLVKGKMLADAMYLDESELQKGVKPLTNLQVYFDTPILLRVLGYMGDELAPPYIELIDLLETQGALVRCFQSNVEEAERILERAEERAADPTPGPASGDVYKHFDRTGATPADIAIKRERLSTDLLKLRIQPVDLPPPRPRHSFDEDALKRKLQREIPGYRPRPLATDIAALAAVYRLREGISARTLSRSRAVFVTRNYNLHKVSSEFFRQLDPDEKIPLCIPMSAFTTMVWVRQPMDAPDLPKNRIIADAVAAMRPSPELWGVFNAEIDKLRREGGISPGLAYKLRVSFESEQALMDQTLGDENEYVEGRTAKQVAERALENERFASQRHQEKVEGRARACGRWAARLLFAFVIPMLCVGAIFGTLGVFANLESPVPGFLQWPATVLFAVLTILSFYDGVSFRSQVRAVAQRFEHLAVKVVRFVWGFSEEG